MRAPSARVARRRHVARKTQFRGTAGIRRPCRSRTFIVVTKRWPVAAMRPNSGRAGRSLAGHEAGRHRMRFLRLGRDVAAQLGWPLRRQGVGRRRHDDGAAHLGDNHTRRDRAHELCVVPKRRVADVLPLAGPERDGEIGNRVGAGIECRLQGCSGRRRTKILRERRERPKGSTATATHPANPKSPRIGNPRIGASNRATVRRRFVATLCQPGGRIATGPGGIRPVPGKAPGPRGSAGASGTAGQSGERAGRPGTKTPALRRAAECPSPAGRSAAAGHR